MGLFLDGIFCCCSRRDSADENADERAQLLPAAEGGPSSLTYAATVDHQKAKERLQVIVKAKEGKMVRVLSRVPFNLRNEAAGGLANSSTSRSNRSFSTNVTYANAHASEQYDENDRMQNSSPVPSPSISRSESASSAQRLSVSRVSTDDLSEPYTEHKLKVSLVSTAKNSKRAYSRRGRSKTKQGRFGDDADELANVPTLEGIQSVDSGRADLLSQHNFAPTKISVEGGTASGSNGLDHPQVTALSDEENADIKALSKQISQRLKEDFEDVGTLTRSWGK